MFGENFATLAKTKGETRGDSCTKENLDYQEVILTGLSEGPLPKVPGLRGWLPLQQRPVQAKGLAIQQQQICHETEKMTINTQLCTRLVTCESVIKPCDQYSVTGFPSTSHIGSYKQHEPVNKVYKRGWTSVTLPTKLGSADSGLMGAPYSGWLPARLDKYAIPIPHATTNTNHNRECNSHNSRGCRVGVRAVQ